MRTPLFSLFSLPREFAPWPRGRKGRRRREARTGVNGRARRRAVTTSHRTAFPSPSPSSETHLYSGGDSPPSAPPFFANLGARSSSSSRPLFLGHLSPLPPPPLTQMGLLISALGTSLRREEKVGSSRKQGGGGREAVCKERSLFQQRTFSPRMVHQSSKNSSILHPNPMAELFVLDG